MLIRITESSPGCVFEPGELIRVNDKRGRKLIDAGVAYSADELEISRYAMPSEISRLSSARAFMEPPRLICGCGYVAKDEEGLLAHKEEGC